LLNNLIQLFQKYWGIFVLQVFFLDSILKTISIREKPFEGLTLSHITYNFTPKTNLT